MLIAISFKASGQNATAPPQKALPYFTEPTISPDRSEIAFVSAGDVWTVPATGGEARLLVSHPANESRPLFSPDGRRWYRLTNCKQRHANSKVANPTFLPALVSVGFPMFTDSQKMRWGLFWELLFQLVLAPNDPVEFDSVIFIHSVTVMTVDRMKALYGSSPTRCSRPMNLGSGRRLSNIGSTLSKTNRESRSTRALSSHAKACSLSPSAA